MRFENIKNAIEREEARQKVAIDLIPSENVASADVKEALGSCLTNKYTEGYPAVRELGGNTGRYYGGCVNYDYVEEQCCLAWAKVFNTNYHVNVQPHSGSNANMAAFMAVLEPGDTILSMCLSNGGHLTHGSPVNFSGKQYRFVFYDVDENGFIDMDCVERIAEQFKPKLILAGASAYSRTIDFRKFAAIAARNNAYFMVDMAHIAGLIAAGEHPSPFGLADIITTTTHKTLRGPRGGMIFCKPDLAKKIDSAVFPGVQGGPLQNVICAKWVAAEEALEPSYRDYIANVVKNNAAFCQRFIENGYKVVTGGTDNHLFLVDFSETHPNVTGKMVQEELEKHGIICNKNCVPGDKRSPFKTSGIRLGSPAMTSHGWTAADFVKCADDINSIVTELNAKVAESATEA